MMTLSQGDREQVPSPMCRTGTLSLVCIRPQITRLCCVGEGSRLKGRISWTREVGGWGQEERFTEIENSRDESSPRSWLELLDVSEMERSPQWLVPVVPRCWQG